MIITTTNTVEGKDIEEYLGLVTGEAIMGTNIFRDFMAKITDVLGKRSKSYEKKLQEAREIAIKEMQEEAQEKGANALVGIDLSYQVLDSDMLMVTAIGTAVKIK